MSADNTFLMFYLTFPDEQTAFRVGEALLQERLIACINTFPIKSAYWWEGDIVQDNEWVAVVKTRLAHEQLVSSFVETHHPYQTPCILRYEVRANDAYYQWILASTER